MKIGVVTTSFPRHVGDAAGAFVARHAEGLRRDGHQLEVIAAGPADLTRPPNSEATAKIIRVPSSPEACARRSDSPLA
jgi:hypothetical protein